MPRWSVAELRRFRCRAAVGRPPRKHVPADRVTADVQRRALTKAGDVFRKSQEHAYSTRPGTIVSRRPRSAGGRRRSRYPNVASVPVLVVEANTAASNYDWRVFGANFDRFIASTPGAMPRSAKAARTVLGAVHFG